MFPKLRPIFWQFGGMLPSNLQEDEGFMEVVCRTRQSFLGVRVKGIGCSVEMLEPLQCASAVGSKGDDFAVANVHFHSASGLTRGVLAVGSSPLFGSLTNDN